MNSEKSNRLFILAMAACLLLVGTTVFIQGQSIMKIQKSLTIIADSLEKVDEAGISPPDATDSPGGTTGPVTNYLVKSKVQTLITGKFTFQHFCDGEIQNATLYNGELGMQVCIGSNKLVVVRDRREDGGELEAPQTLLTLNVAKPEDAVYLDARFLPVTGSSPAILIDFDTNPCTSVGDCGVCMGSGFNYLYDSVSPGQLRELKNYPQYADGGVWAAGVMAYVPGCASGAAYPVEPVMIYDPGSDKSIVVTETKGVPGHLWDERDGGYPNKGWSGVGDNGSPFWSDLKWNEVNQRFEINLHFVDGDRIQSYFFNAKGEDITPDVL